MNGNGKLTIKETGRLLGRSISTVKRYVNLGKLRGVKELGKFGETWFIDSESALLYLSQMNQGGRGGRGLENSKMSGVLHPPEPWSNLRTLQKDLEGALIQIGKLTNENENYKRMLSEGDNKINKLSQSISKISVENENYKKVLMTKENDINKLSQSLKRWRAIGITTSILTGILALLIAEVMLLS